MKKLVIQSSGVEVVDLTTEDLAAIPTPEDTLELWRNSIEVSRLQAKVALEQAGLLTTVEDVMGGMGIIERLAWSDATVFRRRSPLVNALATQLNLSEEDLDSLFIAAESIEL